MMKPRLTLIGAGPGDPELITLKAVNALRKADVVLYDALANSVLLEYCSPECELIYVGKRGHTRSISQDSLNFLIVEKAYEKGHVVRLKGGDPFIFGRGNEEINFARERGVETAFVPGISSIQALGAADIPLTSRGFADGFWVITGHKADGSLSKDLALAAQSSATVVILMGMSRLSRIAELFVEGGRGDTPAAIVQNASTNYQKTGIGKAKDLVKIAQSNDLKNPALIVIGDVINSLRSDKLVQFKSAEIYS
jgi:uroporphyrin-III C-methyltransferase